LTSPNQTARSPISTFFVVFLQKMFFPKKQMTNPGLK
jgi:hypothetical protein